MNAAYIPELLIPFKDFHEQFQGLQLFHLSLAFEFVQQIAFAKFSHNEYVAPPFEESDVSEHIAVIDLLQQLYLIPGKPLGHS